MDDVELLRIILQKSDIEFEFEFVSNWEEFQQMDLESFDLIISDYNILGFTGLDVIKEVNRRETLLPVIILSGTVGDELAVQLIHAGAYDFLLKDNIRKVSIIINRAMRTMRIEREKHKFQQEIVEKNIMLDTIFDSSQGGIFLKDTEGKYLKVNRAICNLLQLRLDQIIGHTAEEVWPAKAANGSLMYDKEVMDHGLPLDYELSFTDRAGKYKVLELRKTPLKDGENKVIGIIGEIRDITHQRQLVDELQKSQSILSQAENITDSGSFEYNAEQDLLIVSRNLQIITGLKTEHSHISLRRLVTLFKKEDQEIFQSGITKAIEERSSYSGYHRIEINGAILNFKIYFRPSINMDNEHVFFGTLVDVTSDTENNQRQFSLQEEDREEIARELHDNLGQKFNAISMYLSKIIEDQPENKPLIKTREIVHDSIDDLGRLINSISVKQIEEHSLAFALEKLLSYIDDTISVEKQFEFDEQKISSHIKEHTFRVVQEAVNNVSKYSKASKLKINLIQDKCMLDLAIEDDGVGFDVRSDLVGNGLKNMEFRIGKCNGLVNIHSTKGEGTRIVAKLPCT